MPAASVFQKKRGHPFRKLMSMLTDHLASLGTAYHEKPLSRGAYRVETVSTLAGLTAIERDWNRLTEITESPNVFATVEWFRIWIESLALEWGSDCFRPNVLVVKDGDAVVGLAPLVYRKISRFGFSLRLLKFVGDHCDYGDLLLAETVQRHRVAQAIVQHLSQTADQWDLISLRDLRDEKEISQMKNALATTRLLFRVRPETEGSPYMRLETGTSGILQKMSANGRRNFRREIEAVKRAGLKVRIVEDPQNEPGLVQRLAAVDRKKSVSRGIPPFVSKYPAAFESVMQTLGPRDWLYVALLEKEEQLISFALVFRCGKAIWGYTMAYDPAFARFSPGKVLLSYLWDHSFATGYEEFDFLAGDEAFKFRWSVGSHSKFRFLIWNNRLLSRVGTWAYEDFRPALYRIHQRVRARLRRRKKEQ